MTYETIRYAVDDGIARLTLDRPDAYNSVNQAMARELSDVAIRADEDPAVRAVLVTGAGRAFCGGGDVKTMAAAGADLPKLLKQLTTDIHMAISRVQRMAKPVVVAVNGAAGGGGMSFALAGDLVLAAEGAKFSLGYMGIGLSPDGSSTYVLPRLVGLRKTQELMLTNPTLSAAEALEMGLINRVLPDDRLMPEAEALARRLADGPTRAHGAVKALLQETFSGTLETQMERESRIMADVARSADAQEGVKAFVEKRKPTFTGA
jgi:2-(1,2-epoxy-1,2-dihydrophenyl)acetyl-CoA isomerase